jgi:O-antigen/teichoic acid export membrane protein
LTARANSPRREADGSRNGLKVELEEQTLTAAAAAETAPAAPAAAPAARGFPLQVAGTLAARVLMAANSLATGVVVARTLGAEGLGALAVLNVSVAYAVQIGSLGLPSANTYFIAQDRRRLAPAAANSLAFGVAGGLALALLTVALAARSPRLFEGLPVSLVALAAAAVPFQLLTVLGLNVMLALGRVRRFNLLDLVGQTMLPVNAVVALVTLRAGLRSLVALNTAASVAVCAAVVLLVARLVKGSARTGADEPARTSGRAGDGGRARDDGRAGEGGRAGVRPDFALLRRTLRYGVKVHAQTVAALLLFRVDLLLVKYFRGAAEAGVYSVASQVSLLLLLLPGVVSTLLFPRIAARADDRGALACVVTRHTTFVMLVACAAAAVGVFALPALYGPRFAGATVQALILLPGVLFVGVAGVLSQHFAGTGLPAALPLFWVAALAIDTALNLSLVPAFGARGAATSSTLSYALVGLLIALYFRARTGNTLRSAFVPRLAELRDLLSPRRAAALFR